MPEPAYTNEFKKPVYKVNNLHMKKHNRSQGDSPFASSCYELQLNGEYYLITLEQIEALDAITRLPDNISISMG